MDTADDVIYVDELRDTRFFNSYCGLGNYHISKMQNRNEYMVDWVSEAESGYVIAVWNGSDSGTKNCVDYAREKGGLKIGILNPLDY